MDYNIPEVAQRIRSLREDMEISVEDMAQATDKSVEEYLAQEAGTEDLSFNFLYKVAEKLGVDMIVLLTGDNPHLKGYSLVRAGKGLSVVRRAGFKYLHVAPTFEGKLIEPFIVTAPFRQEEQEKPIALSRHEGQEFDYILSGHLKFVHDDHVEYLNPGDAVLYDSGQPHGMITVDGDECVFLAVVIHKQD